MPASPSPALDTAAQAHFHFAGHTCPYCDQPIPEDKVEEISGRIEARVRERLAEETGPLREQFAREREQDAAKAAAREKAIREEAAAAAEAGAAEKIAAAEAAKAEAEVARSGLAAQIAAERADKSSIVERMKSEAVAREKAVREEATRAAEAGAAEKIAGADTAKAEAERGRLVAEAALAEKLAERGREIEALNEVHAAEINAQREALEKDKIATVKAERAGFLKVRMKYEEDLADAQRRLQQKTPHEHGEGAELDLYEVVKAGFESDRIRRVGKGSPGADLIHEIIEGGKVVGKIVYDRKNRGDWKGEYAAKLRNDQIAEKADFAILSTNKFPKDKRELCTFENVILACPARVLAVAEILRGQIVVNYGLRIGSIEREKKTAALYEFINSPLCGQLLDSVESLVGKMEQVDIDELSAVNKACEKRAGLRQSILKANGNFRFQIRRIVGTADANE